MPLFSKHLILLGILGPLFFAGTVMAENTLLTSQSARRIGNDLRLQIEFEQPMNYISHFPDKHGSQLDIKLRPILVGNSTIIKSDIEDNLNVSRGHGNPVQDISYEQSSSGNGTLSITFVKDYAYDVKPSRDQKSIYVTIKDAMRGTVPADNKTAITAEDTGLPIYVLNLQTGTDFIDASKQPILKNFRSNYDIYTVETKQGRKTIYQLRLGYFHSLSLVKENLNRLKPFYQDAWIDKVRADRRQSANNWFLKRNLDRFEKGTAVAAAPKLPSTKQAPKVAAKSPQTTSKTKPQPSTSSQQTAAKEGNLLSIAKQAMISRDYRKAVNYLTHILQNPDKTDHKEAQELLGLARERQKLPAQAVAEYQKYLKEYPTGPDADRVRQRLNGLLTARAKPNAKLAQVVAAKPKGPAPKWNFFGTFTQFYRNQQSQADNSSTITTANSIDSNLSVSGRRRGETWNQRIDFAGTHRYDFLNNTNASNGTIYTLFYELADKKDDFSMRVGRQTHNSDGVLGRFDGVTVSKRISTHEKLNFLAGFPVDIFLRDSVNTNRQFYAGSIKFESILKNTDTKFYYITQKNYGMTDRQAIGNETQYIDNFRQLFFVADYDVFYKVLNQFTFVGNLRNKNNSSINVVADYRKSPLLTTNNALIGQQGSSTLEQLRQSFTSSEINQLAQDRTSTSTSLTVSASTQLSQRYQLSGDVNISNLKGTPASGGVAASDSTGNQYYYNMSLIGTNMLSKNDVTIVGLRYNTDISSHTISSNFSTRLNLNKTWRVNPRFSIDWRNNDDGSKRITYTPRIIVDYRQARDWRYELEFGYQNAKTTNIQSSSFSSSSSINYYIYLGYIHDF